MRQEFTYQDVKEFLDYIRESRRQWKERALRAEAELARLYGQFRLALSKAEYSDGSLHPAACGPGCRSQHTDDHSGCALNDGDVCATGPGS